MTNETKQPPKQKKRPFLTMLGVLSVLLLVVVIAVIAFPGTILRYVFSRVEAQTGITITFDNANFYLEDGSFLHISGLSVKRQNHPVCNFDLKAESVRMPAMMPIDFYSPALLITGLHGTVERVGNEETDEEESEKIGNDTAEKNETGIRAVMLVNSEIDFIDRTLEKPFRATIQITNFLIRIESSTLFDPYACGGAGLISTAKFDITYNEQGDQKQKIGFTEVPFGLVSPYAPVLDDIFVTGSMNVQINEMSDELQKKLRVNIWLLSDCQIKPANEILAPAIQSALRTLDESPASGLHDAKGKIEKLRVASLSLRTEVDKVAQLVGAVIALAPRDVREKYENAKNKYDQITNAYDEWNTKFETLQRDLDRVKVNIIGDTFKYFIDHSVPIEIDLQEVDGEWQYDGYDVVARLIERNYRAIIAAQYQQRIQEINESVERLLAL